MTHSEMFDTLKLNGSGVGRPSNNGWPFKSMSVGDTELFFAGEKAKRAQVYCHVYGRQSGKTFSTATDPTTGNVYIKRTA